MRLIALLLLINLSPSVMIFALLCNLDNCVFLALKHIAALIFRTAGGQPKFVYLIRTAPVALLQQTCEKIQNTQEQFVCEHLLGIGPQHLSPALQLWLALPLGRGGFGLKVRQEDFALA